MVVVDKLSKQAHFILLTVNNTAENLSNVFYKELTNIMVYPRVIISYRDSRFTSTFWKEFMKLLKVMTNISTAFDPQTDGQSERAFRTFHGILLCFIKQTQKDWKRHLPGLNFFYNNHQNDEKNISLLHEIGQNPISVSDILLSDASKSGVKYRYLKNKKRSSEIANSFIESAELKNAEHVSKRRAQKEFALDDKVMLSVKTLTLKKRRAKILAQKFCSPLWNN